jgi:acyl-CoA synthetase (AMP-forming)/AMP-acid ligase II
MNLSIGLAQVARRAPDNPAILWQGGALSYGGFEDQVARIAGALRGRHGLKPGDRVGMAMENSAEFLSVLYGIWRAGMTAIPMNAKLHPRELAWILANAGAPLCIATPKLADALGGVAGVPPLIATGSADYAALLAGAPVTRVASEPGDPAWIFYTSGTTGRPKGAVLTHRNLTAMSADARGTHVARLGHLCAALRDDGGAEPDDGRLVRSRAGVRGAGPPPQGFVFWRADHGHTASQPPDGRDRRCARPEDAVLWRRGDVSGRPEAGA